MPQYTESKSFELGIKHTMYIWNLLFKSEAEPNFFVEPWYNQELRLRSCFEVVRGESVPSLILHFHLLDSELSQIPIKNGRVYLYGANNQVNVAQRRVFGTIRESDDMLTDFKISTKIKDRLLGQEGDDPLRDSQKRDTEKIEEALRLLGSGGHFFYFVAESFAHSGYQRG